MAILKRWLGEAALFALASPVLALRAIVTALCKGKFLVMASRTKFLCDCGSDVSLVGLWRCGCGFTYKGHLLQVCPICGTLPRMVRCYACGVTQTLPER
jgi:hypothetical protein